MNVAQRVTSLELETLVLELEGPILRVAIHRPEALNALSPQVVAELRQVFGSLREALGISVDRAAADDAVVDGTAADDAVADWSVRGVILTGSGARAFAAGADIAAMRDMSPEQLHQYGAETQELTLWIETLPIPVIAAVNGFALGGGCELALACDYIFASENASFGQPEVGLGLIPGFGGTVRLTQYASVDVAREMILTGRRLEANEALRLGIISRVLPDTGALYAAARESLQLAAAQSPTAVARAKRTIRAVQFLPTEEGLRVELDAFAAQFRTADAAEGISAFLEKRRAQFPGK